MVLQKKAHFTTILIYFNKPIEPRKKKRTNFAPICERVFLHDPIIRKNNFINNLSFIIKNN